MATMRKALATALASDEVRKRFEDLGVSADAGGPAEVSSYIRQDLTRWGAIIREQNIQPE